MQKEQSWAGVGGGVGWGVLPTAPPPVMSLTSFFLSESGSVLMAMVHTEGRRLVGVRRQTVGWGQKADGWVRRQTVGWGQKADGWVRRQTVGWGLKADGWLGLRADGWVWLGWGLRADSWLGSEG